MWLSAVGLCAALPGCSLFVMMGKILVGDPMVDDDFRVVTGHSLSEKGKKVAILCQTPESIKSEHTSLDLDLIAEVSRRLALHKVDVIKPHLVARWLDDHDGQIDELTDMARDLGADYIVQIRVESFAFREENSPNLLRGRANGTVDVFSFTFPERAADEPREAKADLAGGVKEGVKKLAQGTDKPRELGEVPQVRHIYSRGFRSVYPVHQPVPIDHKSPHVFRKMYVDRVSDELARLFYKHKAGSDI